MKHSAVVVLDTMLRCAWYSNARFPLSAALLVSSGVGMRRLPFTRMEKKQIFYTRRW